MKPPPPPAQAGVQDQATAEARHARGLVLARARRYEEACGAWAEALQLAPRMATAHAGLGAALGALGHDAGARLSLTNSLRLQADHRTAWLLGEAIRHPDGAPASSARYFGSELPWPDAAAGTQDPASLQSAAPFQDLVSVAAGYRLAGRKDLTLAALRAAQACCADDPVALATLAGDFVELGDRDAALATSQRALALAPENPRVLASRGWILRKTGDLQGAIPCYRRALDAAPADAITTLNLGFTQLLTGATEEAIATFREGLRHNPRNADLRSNLLFALTRSNSQDMASLFAAHRAFGADVEAALRPLWPAHPNLRDPARRLKVGVLSADLQHHPIAFFFEPVLGHLARSGSLEMHAYSNSAIVDRVTRRMQEQLRHWRQVEGLSDDDLARAIQDDGIDILIELSGHTGGNRLPALARKPAPIQATWTGYPYTTGMNAIDYFIGDDHFPAAGYDKWFAERIVRLPASVCFAPSPLAVAPNPLPALENGYLSFASFNHSNKITARTLAIWAEVLRAVPDARLQIYLQDPDAMLPLLERALFAEGVDRQRVELRRRLPLSKYLLAHHEVDLCLDTLPYSGGTTTLHALSMGVPTLTLLGATPPGHVGVSLLKAVGLDGFTANTPAQLAATARHWAAHLQELAEIRQGLPGRLARSPIGRPELIAASLERALRLMWQRWCAGLEPVGIRVGLNTPLTSS